MDIVLIRHGVRDRARADGALSQHGQHQARILAQALALRGVVPSLVLSSEHAHARETARLMLQEFDLSPSLVPLPALTPKAGPGELDDLVRQARAEGELRSPAACVFVVGHEGRLSNLLTEMTGRRSHPLSHGSAVCIRASSVEEFVAGHGLVQFRYPTVDYLEDALRAKINSKMTVATFLSGFVFTALSALLLGADEWPWHRLVASTALTASLVLFVASVYIYDQLGTPAGFWTDAKRPWKVWQRLYDRREDQLEQQWLRMRDKQAPTPAANGTTPGRHEQARLADDEPVFARQRLDGPVYWLMVQTSSVVFTPAVVLALIGFVALLVGAGEWPVWAGGLAALTGAGLYAAWHRPNLGAD
jgi:phosphohistidine phosphatase SixA